MADEGDIGGQLPWEQAVRLNRRLIWVIAALVVVILALAGALAGLAPLKQTELKVVEFRSGTNNFVEIASAKGELRANEVLRSKEARRYVAKRERVDQITEPERYVVVRQMSSDDVWRRFRRQYEDLIAREGFKRDVVITRDSHVAPGVHRVEFRTEDSNGYTGHWAVNIQYEYRDERVSYENRLLNPTGMVVTAYSLSRRNVEDE